MLPHNIDKYVLNFNQTMISKPVKIKTRVIRSSFFIFFFNNHFVVVEFSSEVHMLFYSKIKEVFCIIFIAKVGLKLMTISNDCHPQ